MSQTLDFRTADASNIDHFRQNKLSYVADDLEGEGLPRQIVLASLMARGVGKWLACRRDVIRLKNTWRSRITDTLERIRVAKQDRNQKRLAWERGYLRGINECRQELRAICHSQRWRTPDHDKRARRDMDEV